MAIEKTTLTYIAKLMQFLICHADFYFANFSIKCKTHHTCYNKIFSPEVIQIYLKAKILFS